MIQLCTLVKYSCCTDSYKPHTCWTASQGNLLEQMSPKSVTKKIWKLHMEIHLYPQVKNIFYCTDFYVTWQLMKGTHIEFHVNLTNWLITDTRSQPDRHMDRCGLHLRCCFTSKGTQKTGLSSTYIVFQELWHTKYRLVINSSLLNHIQ